LAAQSLGQSAYLLLLQRLLALWVVPFLVELLLLLQVATGVGAHCSAVSVEVSLDICSLLLEPLAPPVLALVELPPLVWLLLVLLLLVLPPLVGSSLQQVVALDLLPLPLVLPLPLLLPLALLVLPPLPLRLRLWKRLDKYLHGLLRNLLTLQRWLILLSVRLDNLQALPLWVKACRLMSRLYLTHRLKNLHGSSRTIVHCLNSVCAKRKTFLVKRGTSIRNTSDFRLLVVNS